MEPMATRTEDLRRDLVAMQWAVAVLACGLIITGYYLAGQVELARTRAEIAEIHLSDCQAAAAAQVYP